jgi:hypothetical protein
MSKTAQLLNLALRIEASSRADERDFTTSLNSQDSRDPVLKSATRQSRSNAQKFNGKRFGLAAIRNGEEAATDFTACACI